MQMKTALNARRSTRLLFAGVCLLSLCAAGQTAIALAAARARTEQARTETQFFVRLLENRYHSAAAWKAIFLERYSEGPRDIRLESGTAYFRRPDRMRWEYESPEKKLFVADGKTVWFYVPADKTVTRAPMKESADWRTPLALLTGKVKLERLCGPIEMVAVPAQGARTEGALEEKNLVTLRCLPRQESSPGHHGPSNSSEAMETAAPFDEILLRVNRQSGDLADVIIRQPGGVEMEYRFGHWQSNVALPDSMFQFQAPPGVAIVEETPSGAPVRE